MEPIRPRPGNTTGRNDNTPSGQPLRPRPIMSDFAPRRPAFSDGGLQRPVQPSRPVDAPQHVPHPINPQLHQAPAPSALRPMQTAQTATEPMPLPRLEDDQKHESHAPKVPHETAHAGLVGLFLFVVLAALLFSPILPGKVLDNFPGSSASFSTGDQSLACMNPLQNVRSSQKYDSKLGSPIVYKYATTSTQTGTCAGKIETAITGHTSQFNPLGAIINLAVALLIAVVLAKLWRRIFAKHR